MRSLAGRAQGRAGLTWKGGRSGATIVVAQSDSVLKADWLPWPMSVNAGQVDLFAGGLKLSGVRGSVGASAVSEAAAEFSYSGPFRIVSASGKATPVLAEIYPWLRSQEGLAQALEHSQVRDRQRRRRRGAARGQTAGARDAHVRGHGATG